MGGLEVSRRENPLTLPFAILIAAIWSFSQIYMAETTGSYITGEGAFVTVFLVSIIVARSRRKLTPSDFAILFCVVEGASASSAVIPALVGLPVVLSLPSISQDLNQIAALMPSFYSQSPRILTLALMGNAPIPLRELLPSYMYSVLLNSILWIALVFLSYKTRPGILALNTISYPVPSATREVVAGSLSGDEVSDVILRYAWIGLVVGFALVSFTQGYLASLFLADIFVIPSGLTGILYSIGKDLMPGSLLGLDIASSIPYIWLLMFVPSGMTFSVALASAAFYLVILPIEYALGVIPQDAVRSYDSLLSASNASGIRMQWVAFGLLLISATHVAIKVMKRYRHENPLTLLSDFIFLGFFIVIPSIMFASIFGGSAIVVIFVLVFTFLTMTLWSSRGLAEMNIVVAPIELQIGVSWPMASSLFGLGQNLTGASLSFFVTSFIVSNASIGGATSLESLRFSSLMEKEDYGLPYVIVGSLVGLILGPIFFLWLLFRLGAQSSILGSRLPYYTDSASGLTSASLYLINGQEVFRPDSTSLAIGLLVGSLVTFGLPALARISISPLALALGAYLDPAQTLIPYAFVGLLRFLLLERQGSTSTGRPTATKQFFAGMAAGSLTCSLVSNLLSTLFA